MIDHAYREQATFERFEKQSGVAHHYAVTVVGDRFRYYLDGSETTFTQYLRQGGFLPFIYASTYSRQVLPDSTELRNVSEALVFDRALVELEIRAQLGHRLTLRERARLAWKRITVRAERLWRKVTIAYKRTGALVGSALFGER
jgi:hypothetical protein